MRRRIHLLLSVLLALMAVLISAAPATAASAVREEVKLDSWNFQYGPDVTTPPDEGGWQSKSLPFTWYPHLTSDDPNIVLNPGFEDGLTSWAANPTTAALTADTTVKHSGNASGKIANRSAIWNSPQQDITGLLDERGQGAYDFSVWMKLASGSDNVTLNLTVIASGQSIKYLTLASGTANSTDFTQTSGSTNVTWTGTLTKALLYVSTKTSLVDLNIDDISMVKRQEQIPASIAVNPSTATLALGESQTATATVLDQNNAVINNPQIAWTSDNAAVATVSSAGVIAAAGAGNTTVRATIGNLSATVDVTVFETPNLVLNPGFENGIASWAANPATAALTADTTFKHSGSASGKITGRTLNWHGPEQNITAALKAKGQGMYDVSAWVGLSAGTDTAKIGVRIYDDRTGSTTLPLVSGTASTAFSQVSGSANVAWQGTLRGAFLVVTTNSVSLFPDLYLDDVSMVKQVPPQATELVVSPSNAVLLRGESRTVTAAVYDQNGQAMSGLTINWSTDNAAVAGVSNSGVITATGAGSAVVRAVYGSLSAEVQVTVNPPVESAAVTLTGAGQAEAGAEYALIYGLAGVHNISAQDVTISYDGQIFELLGAAPLAANTVIADTYGSTSGLVRYKLATTGAGNALNGNIPVLSLTFRAKAASTGSDIAVVSALLADGQGNGTAATPVRKTVAVIDRTVLQETVESAQSLYYAASEGYADGQYILGAKLALQTALIAAEADLGDPAATQLQLAQAVVQLTQAVAAFEGKRIIPSTGDVSGVGGLPDGQINIVDLGMVAYYYGVAEASPDWAAVRIADIDGNGVIDMYDLAFVARRMR